MFPISNFKFTLEIEGIKIGFSDVLGFDAEVKEVQYREGGDASSTAGKFPGLLKHGQLTLKRGTDSNTALFKWINEVGTGKITKKMVVLTALGDGGHPVAVWNIIAAWPVSYNISEFKGTGGEIVLETLVLAHEGITRIK